jgi:3-dehydroquinate synthase
MGSAKAYIKVDVVMTAKKFRFAGKETEVIVDWDILANIGQKVAEHDPYRIVIITDTNVRKLYGEFVKKKIEGQGIECMLIDFHPGEAQKAREVKDRILDEMLGFATADSGVVAVGGGIVLDVAGYAACEYFREKLKFFAVPTTLMAAHDAAIGAKNAVNSRFAKHSFGVYYSPEFVFVDVKTLQSLSQREIRNGLIESIKHAIAQDPDFLEYLLSLPSDLKLSREELLKVVNRTIDLKLECMKEDEYEMFNPVLHLGHTLGHQIEFHSNFLLTHGEALSLGISAEAVLANKLGMLSSDDVAQVFSIFERIGAPSKLPNASDELFDRIIEGLKYDNKRIRQGTPFFLLKKFGIPPIAVYEDTIPKGYIRQCLTAIS